MRDIALGLALKFHETTRGDEAAVLATAVSFNAFLLGGEAPAAEQPEPVKPATTRKKSTDKSANDSDTSNKQTLDPVETPSAPVEPVAPTSSTPVAPSEVATTAAPLEITRDVMLAEATSYSQKHDLAVVLGKLGAERFSAVPAERYPEFMALLTEGASGGNALD